MTTWRVSGLPQHYGSAELVIPPGLSLLVGINHSGKTALLGALNGMFANASQRAAGHLSFQPDDNECPDLQLLMPSPGPYRLKGNMVLPTKDTAPQPNINPNTGMIFVPPHPETQCPPAVLVYLRSLLSGGSKYVLTRPGIEYQCQSVPVGWNDYAANGTSNLAAAIDAIQEANRDRYLEWLDHLTRAFPLIQKVDVAAWPNSPGWRNLFVDFAGRANRTPLNAAGTGIAQCAMALYAVMFAPPHSVILLDEATQHLHPAATKAMLESIAHFARNKHVLAATHDPTAIRSPIIENVILIKCDGPHSQLHHIHGDDKLDILREIGLDSADLLFALAVLIAEGKTDNDIIREAQRDGLLPSDMAIASLDGLRILTARRKIRRETLRLTLTILRASTGAQHRVALFVDSDCRHEQRNQEIAEDLEKITHRPPKFTVRSSIENYFLDARLIHEFVLWFKEHYPGPDYKADSPELLAQALQEAIASPACYPNKTVPPSPEERVRTCDAVDVLQNVLSRFLGTTINYADHKADYGFQMYRLDKTRGLHVLDPWLAEVRDAMATLHHAGDSSASG